MTAGTIPFPIQITRCLAAVLAVVAITGGCGSTPPAAPISTYEFSPAQQTATMALLRDLAGPTSADARTPLELVPEDGIRWSTIPDAVDHAIGHPSVEMAVVASTDAGDRQVLYLTNRFGWPACVIVSRRPGQTELTIEVRCGPYPDYPSAQRMAQRIERRVADAIVQYGRIRRLPRYDAGAAAGHPATEVDLVTPRR